MSQRHVALDYNIVIIYFRLCEFIALCRCVFQYESVVTRRACQVYLLHCSCTPLFKKIVKSSLKLELKSY